MPFDRQQFADDEVVLVDTRLHWLPLAGPALLVLVALVAAMTIWVEFPGAPVAVAWLLVAMVGFPVLWLGGRALSWRGVRLVVTTGRLVYRKGVLGRDVAQLRLQRVAEVHCTQTLGDRLIGSGRVVLEVAGGESMVIDHVRRPRALQRVIAGQLDGVWSAGYGLSDPMGGPAAARPPSRLARRPADDDWGEPTQMSPRPRRRGHRTEGGHPAWTATPPHGTAVVELRHGAAVADRAGPGPGPGPGAGASVPDQLIRLDELRRRGIITADEFRAKKAELLNRL